MLNQESPMDSAIIRACQLVLSAYMLKHRKDVVHGLVVEEAVMSMYGNEVR